jgi:hypothetical protein
MTFYKSKWRVDLIILLWIAITYGILMIAIEIFEWRLYETLTGFVATPLIIISQLVFLFLIFLSVIYIVFETKKDGWRAILPLVVNIIVLGVIMYVPFYSLHVNLEANVVDARKNDFKQVISFVESGKLIPDEDGTIVLPEKFKELSSGQIISVDTSDGVLSVFFYNFGLLDNYSGYMYRSNDTPPPVELIGDWYLIERLEPFWYYCASI